MIAFLIYVLIAALIVFVIVEYLIKAPQPLKTIIWVVFVILVLLLALYYHIPPAP